MLKQSSKHILRILQIILHIHNYDELEKLAENLTPGSDGLSVLPYWLGVRNPYWNSDARGAVFGLTGHHKREHLYRAVLEGIALDQAARLKQLQESTGVHIDEYFAVGGGSNSNLWCQILADVLECPVHRQDSAEASALGAGVYNGLVEASEKMRGKTTASFTTGKNSQTYQQLSKQFKHLYPDSQSVERHTI